MSNFMTILIMTLVLTLYSSCTQQPSRSEELQQNIAKVKQEVQAKADSIVLNYWESTEANEYHFFYTKDKVEINSIYFNFEKSVNDEFTTSQFSSYINQFYLDKTEKIILSKKEEPAPVSDYPVIAIVGYLKGKRVIEEKTTLYSNVEFNPKFIEF